jgi:hypothetical protein
MQMNWNDSEEQLIAEAMADGLTRIQAIRRQRSSWRIGETPPPMSREGRKMPKDNPRHNQTVEDSVQNRPEASTLGSLRGEGASTSPSARLEAKRLQAASLRQARRRAKKKLAEAA